VWGFLPENRNAIGIPHGMVEVDSNVPMVADNHLIPHPPASPAQRRHAERAGRAAHGVLDGPNAGIAQDAAALADDASDDDGGRAGPEADGRRRRTRGTSARASLLAQRDARRAQKAAAPPAPRMTPLARPRPARPNRRGARERGGGARRRRPAQERRGLRVQTRPLVRIRIPKTTCRARRARRRARRRRFRARPRRRRCRRRGPPAPRKGGKPPSRPRPLTGPSTTPPTVAAAAHGKPTTPGARVQGKSPTVTSPRDVFLEARAARDPRSRMRRSCAPTRARRLGRRSPRASTVALTAPMPSTVGPPTAARQRLRGTRDRGCA